jgi:hypothetical protein
MNDMVRKNYQYYDKLWHNNPVAILWDLILFQNAVFHYLDPLFKDDGKGALVLIEELVDRALKLKQLEGK